MPETEDQREGLTLEVSADDPDEEARAATSRVLLSHPVMRHEFPTGDLWLVRFELLEKEGPSNRFSALVQDTVTGRMMAGRGLVGEPSSVDLLPLSNQRAPNDEEFAWAVSALSGDEELSAVLAEPGASTYRPVPPLANVANPDGSVDRVIAVGIRSGGGEPLHRIVGVRTDDGTVVAEPFGAPSVWNEECGVAPSDGECPQPTGPAQARVGLATGQEVLWQLLVVRPSASSGTNGSGVELREVDYKGQRVLERAHIPIVTVRDDDEGSGCGPSSRVWLYEEACFGAKGVDQHPGFRICSEPPSTILDTGDPGGDFRGVAVWSDGEDLLIVSQLQAGWYRYVTEWRLRFDGTIQPRFGVATTRNPCTCRTQVHHAYWRFDFDILGPANNLVQEHNDEPVMGTSPWHTTHHEVRRDRDVDGHRYWRVRNVRSSQGYSLVPGEGDGEADDYGVGDVWILRQHDDEIDDGQGLTTDPAVSRAQLDRFVNGESVERQDVVLWYSGHLRQEPGDAGRRMGPDLVPSNWRDLPTTTERFAPPEPPRRPD
ncbi:MAG: hypothetical protein M3179_12615 [Actinomycetota bacterium]|nr:hypothetical protein [Actinomycetota bacterium]